MSIYELEQDVKAEVQERIDELKESIYPSDLLSEIVDYHTPAFYQELAACLADDPSLAYVDDPGLIDPSNGVYQIIQAAIYERLSQAAFEAYENLPEEDEAEDVDLFSMVVNICDPSGKNLGASL